VNTTTRSDAYLRIAACRGELLLDAPFFGTLALKLALVEDHTCVSVSDSQGVAVSTRAIPPHRSTTVSPSQTTHTEAPTSPRSAKLRTNS